MIVLYTIGFTKKSAQEFFTILGNNQVSKVVDVRLNNTSQLSGFAKKSDLKYFLREIAGIDYVHMSDLAPTTELLREYRKDEIPWSVYEKQYLDLIASRTVETDLEKSLFDRACLLCSEETPHHCHRRLLAEYLRDKWGDIEIIHL